VEGGGYRIPITVTSASFTQRLEVGLLVSTSKVFLPLTTR